MNVCPICKSYNFIKITSNSKENIKLTDKNYSYNKCLNCFVISQNPLPNHSTLNKHYKFLDKLQANKKNYPKKLSILFKIKDSYQKHNFQNFLRDFFKFGEKDYTYFNILNPGNILDLGAGNGIFSIAAKQKGFEVISIEQNQTSINFAEKLGVKIVPADINSQSTINYASQVDNITLNHVLEHVKQPINFLNTLKKNIKQKAKIVIVVPNSDSIWRFIFREKWYGWDPPVHVHLYNQRSLRIIMTQIGMEIEYLKSLNRIDSLYSALIHAGYKVKRFKLFLRVISLPLLPILKVFNISPEIICVVKKK